MITKTVAVLDLTGLSCPLPIVKTAQAIKGLIGGDIVEVLATDPGSVPDFDAWCKATGHTLLERVERDGVFHFLIQKG